MKKTILLCLQLFFIVSCMSQQLQNDKNLSRQDYLSRSKENRTGGLILLGAGAALTTGGFISLNTSDWLNGDDTPFILFTTGIGSMLGSIPLFIISGNQAKKAANISGKIKMELFSRDTYVFQKNKTMPAVSVVLKF